MLKKVGFIGLGIMGKPMAYNIIKAGYPLIVHNRSRQSVNEIAQQGAEAATSPKEVAWTADIIFTMLPEDTHVEEVVTGENGIIQGLRNGAVVVDMSTISPATARKIADRLEAAGGHMLDAPVSGGDVGAREATLSIMVGGKPDVFERVLPLFQKIGKNINYIGDCGAGQVAKAANQIIVGITIEAVAEALIFAKKSGVDPAKVRSALMGGFAQSRVLELHGQRMIERNFKPGGKVRSHKKDTEISITAAKELGMYLPATALLSHLWNAVAAQGGLDWDHSSIVKVLETLSNVEVSAG